MLKRFKYFLRVLHISYVHLHNIRRENVGTMSLVKVYRKFVFILLLEIHYYFQKRRHKIQMEITSCTKECDKHGHRLMQLA